MVVVMYTCRAVGGIGVNRMGWFLSGKKAPRRLLVQEKGWMRKEDEEKREMKGRTRQGEARQAERLDDAAARSMGRVTAAGKDPIRCAMQCNASDGEAIGVGTHWGVRWSCLLAQARAGRACSQTAGTSLCPGYVGS